MFSNILREHVFAAGGNLGAAFAPPQRRTEERIMNLWIWLPALFVLGTVTMAALFAFVFACEKV